MSKRPDPLPPDAAFTHHMFGARRVAFTALEFWRWGFSNVRENRLRGILAEFIVARALNLKVKTRQAWDEADLVTPEGVTIEVKSSGYLQAWEWHKRKEIVFRRLRTFLWRPESGSAATAELHSEVYVFCVHASQEDEEYDPLNLDQWQFWAVSRAALVATGQMTFRQKTLSKLGVGPVGYAALKSAVGAVARESRAA